MTSRSSVLTALFCLLAACAAPSASTSGFGDGDGSDDSDDGTSGDSRTPSQGTSSTPSATATTSPTAAPSSSTPATTGDPRATLAGFPAHWIDGTACGTDPEVQEWQLAQDFYILRQSLCTNYEGPFVYLIIGAQKALMVDTGTGDADLYAHVSALLAGKNVQLVVAHSHSHGDHVGGDSQFKNKANVSVVSSQTSSARAFFNVSGSGAASFDLGNRTVDVLAIPGHQAAHLAFYDRVTKVLLSGDTLYPGRLYVDDWQSYKTSIPRLVSFVGDGRPVSYVLGGHIELPATGADFQLGSTRHPNEHVLQLGDADLRELASAVAAMGNSPHKDVHSTFIIDP